MRWLILAALTVSSLSLVSCKSDESDDLAKAQACLDAVPQSNPASAEDCLQFVSKYDTQQANILKCSILLTSGGLVENRVVKAFNALKTSSAGGPGVMTPTASLLAYLALTIPNPTDGKNIAKRADGFCDKTGIKTIMSISKLILLGSVFNDAVGPLGFADPPTQANLTAAIGNCTGVSACDPGTVGIAASSLAESYCSSGGADVKTCDNFDAAIAAGAGDNVEIGKAVICYLNGQTYNIGTHACQ